jgi:hypothetical protein
MLELNVEDNFLTLQEVSRRWTENRITYGLVICTTQYSHNITWIRTYDKRVCWEIQRAEVRRHIRTNFILKAGKHDAIQGRLKTHGATRRLGQLQTQDLFLISDDWL